MGNPLTRLEEMGKHLWAVYMSRVSRDFPWCSSKCNYTNTDVMGWSVPSILYPMPDQPGAFG